MTTPTYTINTPLINYFLYKDGPNMGCPLINGTIEFFTESDHSILADTYSDISDPDNPVVNTNPIVLDAVGSCPVIYLQDIYYFIVIKSQEGQTIQTYTFYRGAAFTGGNTPGSVDPSRNLIANGQFNYPIQFYKTNEAKGQISKINTNVAFGWEFIQNDQSKDNFVFFDDIANEILEARPLNQIRVTSNISTTQSSKDLQAKFGHVAIFEGQPLTFSCQLINLTAGTVPIVISIEKNYGALGSPTTITPIATFDVTQVRTKFIVNFTSPTVAGSTIGSGNYDAIRISYPVNQGISIGLTNVNLQIGTIIDPIFLNEDISSEKSQIIGNSTFLTPASLYENYSHMRYVEGNYYPVSTSGIINFCSSGASFPDKLEIETPGQTLKVSDYSENNIPFQRLYDVIGNTYGGQGELIVTSSSNVVTGKSSVGAVERSAWTTGTVGTAFTITNTVIGLKYGLNVEYFPGGTGRELEFTWTDTFAINRISWPNGNKLYPDGVVGNGFLVKPITEIAGMETSDIDVGSPTTQPKSKVTFISNSVASYQTYQQSDAFYNVSHYLEFGVDVSNNVRGAYGNRIPSPVHSSSSAIIRFKVDGAFGPFPGFNPVGILHTIDFNMISSQTVSQNVSRFITEIANPFEWTITILSPPAPGQYFEYSAGPSLTGVEYYGWYTVNGAGIDPVVAGKTGVQIDILSTDSINQISTKTAKAMNSLDFKLPTPGIDLPTLPSTLTSYFINL